MKIKYISIVFLSLTIFIQGLNAEIRKSYYESGELQNTTEYKNNKKNGLYISYYKNGVILYKELYKNNKSVYSMRYHKNGSLYKKDKYINGKEYSEEIYNKNGKVEFSIINDVQHGMKKRYIDKKKPNSVMPYSYFGDILYSSTPYVNGKKEGLGKIYYDDGKAAALTFYKNDKIQWKKSFYKDGTKANIYDGEFINGLFNGTITYFYSNKKVSSIETYKHQYENLGNHKPQSYDELREYETGYKYGPYIKYHGTGNIYYSLNYKHNSLDGLQQWYYPSGYLKKEAIYNLARPVSETYYQDPDTKKWYSVFLNLLKGDKNNSFKLQGLQETHYSNGELRSESYYKDGKLNGTSKIYYNTGELYIVEEYKDSKLLSRIKYYKDGSILRKFKKYK